MNEWTLDVINLIEIIIITLSSTFNKFKTAP